MSDHGEYLSALPLELRTEPLNLPWPMPGRHDAVLSFADVDDWRAFVAALDLDDRIPAVVRVKFARALRLLLLAWIEPDLVKASELVAMTALELALRDRYRPERRTGRPPAFGTMLRDMVHRDGLTDDQLPIVRRCGGSVVGRLTGDDRPSLRELRNGLAHGDPLDALPISGLIELVRDLIEFAYRDYLAAAPAVARRASS